MSTTTANIGLKKPEGTDPFLTDDFDHNYDLIDAAIKALQDDVSALGGSGSGGGAIDAATLQGHAATYFYSPDNPPPGGSGSGGSTDNRPYSWIARANVNSSKAANSTTTYQGPRVVTPSSGILWIMATAYGAFPANNASTCSLTATIDGGAADGGLYAASGVPDFNLTGNSRFTIPEFAGLAVNAGNHTTALNFAVGAAAAIIYFYKIHVLFVQQGSTF